MSYDVDLHHRSQLTVWIHLIPADIYLSVRDGVEAMFMRPGPAVSNRSANVIHTSHCSRACNCYLCNCLSVGGCANPSPDRYWNGFATLEAPHVCPRGCVHDEEIEY